MAAAAVLALTGACAGQDTPVTRSTAAPSSAASAGNTVSAESAESEPGSTQHLDAARRAAGIPDCPVPAAARTPADSQTVPDGLPAIELECLGGDSRVAMNELRGPMVINLWAQWCGPCRTEAPVLAAVSQQAGDKVAFWGVIYADPRPDLAVEFAKEAGWRYPQVVDQERRLQSAGLRVAGQPTTLFVDASGRITANHPGPFTSEQQLREAVHKYLGVTLG